MVDATIGASSDFSSMERQSTSNSVPKSFDVNAKEHQNMSVANLARLASWPVSKATSNQERSILSAQTKINECIQQLPTVRFVPKKTTVRAITNLRTKRFKPNFSGIPLLYNRSNSLESTTSSSSSNSHSNSNSSDAFRPMGTQSFSQSTSAASISNSMPSSAPSVLTNNLLYNCLHVLKKSYLDNKELIGFGVFGMDEIYLQLKQYIEYQNTVATASQSKTEKYYVAVLDLEKCYDNVDTALLYDLVRDILEEQKRGKGPTDFRNSSIIHKYTVSHVLPSINRIWRKNIRYVSDDNEIVTFKEASNEIATKYRNSIITDAVIYPRIMWEEALKLLKNHLFSHIVKIPSIFTRNKDQELSSVESIDASCYTQTKGIPQGSVLSPLLCNLYYGHAEKVVFGSEDDRKLLEIGTKTAAIRMMDDYLVISTDKRCVQHFLQRAHQSLKPFGGGVNPLKTKVNFPVDVEIDGMRVQLNVLEEQATCMPWCGLLVNLNSLEVTPDFRRLLERPLEFSVNCEYSKSGQALQKAIKSFIRMKCHAIILDSAINSKVTVLKSLYSIYIVSGMRMIKFLDKLKLAKITISAWHLAHSIMEGISFGAKLIVTRTENKRCKVLNLATTDDDASGDAENRVSKIQSFPISFGSCEATYCEVIYSLILFNFSI